MTERQKKFKTREEILGTEDLKVEDVWVDAWQTFVRVRTMPGQDREVWEQRMLKQRESGNMENLRASLVAMTAVDDSGALLFDDVAALGRKSAQALDTLFTAAQTLNKLTEKDLQETEKN